MRELSKDKSPHVTDEIFNTASHLTGAILAVLGTVLLVVEAAAAGKIWHIISFGIYGLSLILLFIASSLHHGIDASRRTDDVLRPFDYLAIYPLIAGPYTPSCLVALRGTLGWSVFGVVWGVAIVGIAMKAAIRTLPKWVSNTFYLTLGLMSVVMVVPLFSALNIAAVVLLLLGGVFYIAGNIIFTIEKPNPVPGRFGFHEIWHIFVLAGAFLHYLIMYLYILPMP